MSEPAAGPRGTGPRSEGARRGAWRQRGPLLRGGLPLLAALASLCAGIGEADAGGIVAVISQDLLPYSEALDGIRESTGRPVEALDLKSHPGGEDGVLDHLKSLAPDVVIAIGARAAHFVSSRLPGVPTLICMVLGADVAGLVSPSVTGVALEVPVDRQIAAFRAVVPSLKRLAVLYDPERSAELVRRARRSAAAEGIVLVAERVARPDEVPAAFRRIAERSEGLWLIPDSTVVSRESFDFILRQSVERRLPVMVFSDSMVRVGGLVCLAPENRAVGRQVGDLALRILQNGARALPPVEPPREPDLILNLRTAVALGLRIPDAVVRRARHVYR